MQPSSAHAKALDRLPLIGRSSELALLSKALTEAGNGAGRTVFLSGEGGIGKTRVASAAAEEAAKRGWNVAFGRSYAVETGIPYALFADALLPSLKKLDPSTLSVLTRGGSAELSYLFPALATGSERERAGAGIDPSDLKARLLWNFSQFLGRYAAKQPLCIVLENLQWTDASSLELFHFVARQMKEQRIALIATYNDTEGDSNPALRTTEQSLVRLGTATRCRLEPLSQAEVAEVLQAVFSVDPGSIRPFTALLYGWTRGNPFFVEETLKSLVESGALQYADGHWRGWEVEALQLPPTIRDAVAGRLDRLSPAAREIANLAAVIGTSVTFNRLHSVTSASETELASLLDELSAQRILEERDGTGGATYDFAHPMLQQVTYNALGGARARLLHARVGEALESFYANRAMAHAGELALHFSRSHTFAPKAVRYLNEAGRSALATYANREAASHLGNALEQIETSGADVPERDDIVRNLARARQRLGDYDGAISLWTIAREKAITEGDLSGLASIEHRMGLACYWSGRNEDALTHYAAGLEAARGASDAAVVVRLHLAKGICLQDLGRLDASKAEVESALAAAEQSGDQALLARAHRALLLLYAWSGPASLAREHGEKALQLAVTLGDSMLAWTAHWGMGLLAGLMGEAPEVAAHIGECERLEEQLRSPLLPLWTAEISIQYATAMGDWDNGIAIGERTIALAQALGQRTLLPRLLVWTGLIYLWRNDLVRAKGYFDRAWDLSGAGRESVEYADVPTVVPAHMGLAAYYLETRDFDEAIRVGEAGLAIADRSGYVSWSLQWLLPVIGEAALWKLDFFRAEKHSTRMRRDATRLNNKVGLAVADACDGMLRLYRDTDPVGAQPLLRAAIEALDAIPLPDTAARIRRVLAKSLRDSGDRDGATKELKKAHDVFAKTGAAGELSKVRDDLRDIGIRPPARSTASGTAGLTGRETEIARMVAQRKSNKEIGAALDISARTVSTHLSNIFTKLGVASRGELTDLARSNGILSE
jgi:DNA-binding CsgD family transcriptional regulator/tetratricopeptide (TPR) repeat protein